MADYECIETASDLESMAHDLASEPVLAFDTEADSFYHYFDKVCLVQIATPDRIFLIDPINMGGPTELAPLGPLFASRKIRKIFHAAEYDLFVLKRHCGFRFASLFDTMISAQLLGYPSIGLAALAQRHFGVSLPKDEQRSDWSARPLRKNQLDYAAADVVYLITLAEKLEAELVEAGRRDWASEEFQLLSLRAWPERSFDKLGYLRIKGARSLEPGPLAILRELYLLRDRRARQVDRPPFKIIGNRALLEIAERGPESPDELGSIKGVTDLILRRLGRDLLAAVERGQKRKHGPIPKSNGTGRRRMDRRTEHRVGLLKKWRAARAKELGIDPGVLCPNATLEATAWRNPQRVDELREVSELKGWFVREFGRELTAELRESGSDQG